MQLHDGVDFVGYDALLMVNMGRDVTLTSSALGVVSREGEAPETFGGFYLQDLLQCGWHNDPLFGGAGDETPRPARLSRRCLPVDACEPGWIILAAAASIPGEAQGLDCGRPGLPSNLRGLLAPYLPSSARRT